VFSEGVTVEQTQRETHPVGNPNLRQTFEYPIREPNEAIAHHARIGQEGEIPDRFVARDLTYRREGGEEANHTTIGGHGPA